MSTLYVCIGTFILYYYTSIKMDKFALPYERDIR